MMNKNLSFKIGLLFAAAHLCYFIMLLIEAIQAFPHEQAGMGLFMNFLILDIFLVPVWLIVSVIADTLAPANFFVGTLLPFIIVNGILGTWCWFYIPLGFTRLATRIGKYFISGKKGRSFKER